MKRFIQFCWYGMLASFFSSALYANASIVSNAQIESQAEKSYQINPMQDWGEHLHFAQEKWRYYADVQDKNGQTYTITTTFYRIANGDKQGIAWQNPHIYFSQVVISTETQEWSQQRIARGGIGQAGVTSPPYRLWLDNWVWQFSSSLIGKNQLTITTDDFNLNLVSQMRKPIVLNAEKGYQTITSKGEQAVHAFSIPYGRVSGELVLNDKKHSVKGTAWLEKQWGEILPIAQLGRSHQFSLQLDNGSFLTLTYYIDEQENKHIIGTLVNRKGKTQWFSSEELRLSPVESYLLLNEKELPLKWLIEIPKHKISLIVQPENVNMWMPFWYPVWEGRVLVTGSHSGAGVLQLSGY